MERNITATLVFCLLSTAIFCVHCSPLEDPQISTLKPSATPEHSTTREAEHTSPSKTSKDKNVVPVDREMTAKIFGLYEKWHGVVMDNSDSKIDISQPKIICDIDIDHIQVNDDSRLSGIGKFYGEEFTFNGTVRRDGSLNLTFSHSVASKLSRCVFKKVDGKIYFDEERDVWIYKGNITEMENEGTFMLEPVDNLDSTTTPFKMSPKEKYPKKKPNNSAIMGLCASGGLLILALFGFMLYKLRAR